MCLSTSLALHHRSTDLGHQAVWQTIHMIELAAKVIEEADAEDEFRLQALLSYAEMLHDQGEDLEAGAAVVERGARLGPWSVGLAAAAGKIYKAMKNDA